MATYGDIKRILETYNDTRGFGRKYIPLKDNERMEITRIWDEVGTHTDASAVNVAVWQRIKLIAQGASGPGGIKDAKFTLVGSKPNTAVALVDLFRLYIEDTSFEGDAIAEARQWFGAKFAREYARSIDADSTNYSATDSRRSSLVSESKDPAEQKEDFLRQVQTDLLGVLETTPLDTVFERIRAAIGELSPEEKIASNLEAVQRVTRSVMKDRPSDSMAQRLARKLITDQDCISLEAFISVENNGEDPTEHILTNVYSDGQEHLFFLPEGSKTIHGTDGLLVRENGTPFGSHDTLRKNPLTHARPFRLYALIDVDSSFAKHATFAHLPDAPHRNFAAFDIEHFRLCHGLHRIQDRALLANLNEEWFFDTSNIKKLARLPPALTTEHCIEWLNKLNPHQLTPVVLQQIHTLTSAGAHLAGLAPFWITEEGLDVIGKANPFLLTAHNASALNTITYRNLSKHVLDINGLVRDGVLENMSPHQSLKLYQRLKDLKCPKTYLRESSFFTALSRINMEDITESLIHALNETNKAEIFTREEARLRIPMNEKTFGVLLKAFTENTLPDESIFDMPEYRCHKLKESPLLKRNFLLNIQSVLELVNTTRHSTRVLSTAEQKELEQVETDSRQVEEAALRVSSEQLTRRTGRSRLSPRERRRRAVNRPPSPDIMLYPPRS